MSTSVLQARPEATADASTFTDREPVEDPAEIRMDAGEVSAEVMLASEQLSHLASLHHQSDYSRLKFGANGAPCVYIPMSIHIPDHVKQLKDLQTARLSQRAWWPSTRGPDARRHESLQSNAAASAQTRIPYSDELKEDLHAALTSSLDTQPKIPSAKSTTTQPALRTSDTHPINISTMIPPELLQMISSSIARADQNLPVMFDIPFSSQLHKLLFRPHESRPHIRSASALNALPSSDYRYTALPPPLPHPLNGPSKSSSFVNLLWTQTILRKAVIASTFGHGNIKGFRHSMSIPNSSSVSEPKIMLGRQALDIPPSRSSLHQEPANFPEFRNSEGRSLKRHRTESTGIAQQRENDAVFSLGNLLLSSCPGKKVRLSGPVKGRGAVCRDLSQDLRRMSEMGVRCIVCCLDDSELQYLGAPWHEYSHIASDLGIDVLRIQIPEGLVPLDMEAFDAHLTRLINTYTLTGRHVLVHCRGGVGRAGLVACCWMMKLGLCGWIETEPRLGYSVSAPMSALAPVKSDTLRMVQRVLAVVRKQRSPKAIETFEQVKFLVDYVEYLRSTAKGAVRSGG